MTRETGSGTGPSNSFRDESRRRFVEEARSLYGERRANVSLLRYGSLSAAACVIAAVVGWIAFRVDPQPTGPVVAPLPTEDRSEESAVAIAEIDGTRDDQLTGRGAADAEGQDIVAAATHAALGADVELYSEVRAGTRLIADEGAQWEWRGDRDLALLAGRIYLDVEPGETPFEIRHPDGRVEVLGTRLVVDAQDAGLRVDLGSGKAVLANDRGSVPLEPGEEGVLTPDAAPEKHGARRFSHVASFAAPYIESAEKELGGEESFVPGTAKRPGTERTFELEVVRYHLDIHIEDGFARTTIDQIFRNPSNERVEGTFLFPLPPDASISRLAMYVNGKLMEGGMSERGRAVEVYEGIVRKMLDPAILEWMEGSTFRLRVFPIEPGTERRIILSYQAPLESLYETDRYRFPILRPSSKYGEFSIRLFAKGATGEDVRVRTPTYAFERSAEVDGNIELVYLAKDARPERDVIVEIDHIGRPQVDYASLEANGERSFAVTVRPDVVTEVHRGPRRALILLDRSGKASRSERRAQVELARGLIHALDRTDRVAIMSYETDAKLLTDGFVTRTTETVPQLLALIETEPFVGAGDLSRAFKAAKDLFAQAEASGDVIFYLGDGVDSLSGLEPERLAEIIPAEIPVYALPVNRSWNRRVLGSMAARSGGRVVPVSPDEKLEWRAFDIVTSLRSPEWRQVEFRLLDERGEPIDGDVLADRSTVRHGEPLRIVGRTKGQWPHALLLQGERVALPKRREGVGWIPRFHAKLRIDELERDSAEEHRDEIVRLGKDHYVMTPFTALLVLENDAMYEEHGIDRGRKDHWARYEAPETWHGKATPPQPFPVLWSRDSRFWTYSDLGVDIERFGVNDAQGNGIVDRFDFDVYFGAPPPVIVDGTANTWVRLNRRQPSEWLKISGIVRNQHWNGLVEPLFAIPSGDPAGMDFEDWIAIEDRLSATKSNEFLYVGTTTWAENGNVRFYYRALPVPGVDGFRSEFDDRILMLRGDLAFRMGGEPLSASTELFLIPPVDGTEAQLDGATPVDGRFSRFRGAPRGRGGFGARPHPTVAIRVLEAPWLLSVLREAEAARFVENADAAGAKAQEEAAHREALEALKGALLPDGVEVAATIGGERFVVLENGTRIVASDGGATAYATGGAAYKDPLFETPIVLATGKDSYVASFPWFLVPADVLVRGARVSRVENADRDSVNASEGADSSRTILRIDAGLLTYTEIVIEDGDRIVEVRTLLAGGDLIERVVYEAWENVAGRKLPSRARRFGPDGTETEVVELAYAKPSESDRALAEQVESMLAQAGDGDSSTGTGADAAPEVGSPALGEGPDVSRARFARALTLYIAGEQNALEQALRDAEAKHALTIDLKRIAALAAMRWGADPVVAAVELDRARPEVERWLFGSAERAAGEASAATEAPAKSADDVDGKVAEVIEALERAFESGDLGALGPVMRLVASPEAIEGAVGPMLQRIDELREEAPEGFAAILDLIAGELAVRTERKLKAYECFARAATWPVLRENVMLSDRLSGLASSLHDVERALEHAERSLAILEKRIERARHAPTSPGESSSAESDAAKTTRREARKPNPPVVAGILVARYKAIADLAAKKPDVWTSRGEALLTRWREEAPEDGEVYRRLADFHSQRGDLQAAIRFASHEVELNPTKEAYDRLAERFEAAGEPERANACRTMAVKAGG